MTKPIDIAKAMLVEANNDSVEKLMKACLAAEGKIGIYKHEIFSFFHNEFAKKMNDETMGKLEDAIIPLEESWANSRYPDWSVEPIWIPSQQYTLDNARMSETRMRSVFEILLPFLSEKYKIQV